MTDSRRPFHHGDLSNALIRATLELLETEDVSAISLREVARRAGVSSGAPYHHFPTRADLLVAVALAGFAALDSRLERAERREGTPAERLERRIAAYLQFAAAHPAHYRVMFHDELQRASTAARYDEVARASFEKLVDAVRAVRPRLEERAVRELALTTWAAAHGAVLLSVDTIVGILLAGRRSGGAAHSAIARQLVEMVRAAR